MSKIYLNELAGILAEKGNIDRRTAQRFVNAVVNVIRKGLENDRLVKVKGLGTFKVIEVDARESVNVNTGERLVIEGHSKLTFLPDNSMKELVNKPFSLFETVILNEGVTFDDLNQDAQEEDAAEEATIEEEPAKGEPAKEAPAKEKEEPAEEAPAAEEAPTEEEEPAKEEVPAAEEEKPAEEEPAAEETADVDADEEDIMPLAAPSGRRSWIRAAVCSLLALVVGFAAGYFTGHGLPSFPKAAVEKKAPASVAATAKSAQQPETAVQQEAPVAAADSAAAAQPETAVQQASEPQAEAQQGDEPEWERYNKMSARTRDGAYYIMGLDRIEKARAGDNSKRIASRVYGGPEMSCYIEVYNGITASTVLEAGQEIKIPKIETKKSVRRRLQKQ